MVSSVEYVSVLFSEPKIPQSTRPSSALHLLSCFSALQRAENSSIPDGNAVGRDEDEVSVLFSEPKIPQLFGNVRPDQKFIIQVSVLFSEPKIPQYCDHTNAEIFRCRFSALQRAENSSIHRIIKLDTRIAAFQCSSASRKFLNTSNERLYVGVATSFSALQRAENSSMSRSILRRCARSGFQCSSASRKFLNQDIDRNRTCGAACFSALQRAENSSMFPAASRALSAPRVSVLFSEPKIPQCRCHPAGRACCEVSVLFSEPKIPQSIAPRHPYTACPVSVLFSEPKIPQYGRD